MKYFKITLSFILLFFVGCSVKSYHNTRSKVIIIKSPKLRFADVGYIRNADKAVELELFSAGRVIEKISIDNLICTTRGCMSKHAFNKEYLNGSYPDEMLQDILLAKKIYNGKNFVELKKGFRQNIKDDEVDILYKVTPYMIYFKDRKNKILLKIKDTK